MLDQWHFKWMSLDTIFVIFGEQNFEFLLLRSDFDWNTCNFFTFFKILNSKCAHFHVRQMTLQMIVPEYYFCDVWGTEFLIFAFKVRCLHVRPMTLQMNVPQYCFCDVWWTEFWFFAFKVGFWLKHNVFFMFFLIFHFRCARFHVRLMTLQNVRPSVLFLWCFVNRIFEFLLLRSDFD